MNLIPSTSILLLLPSNALVAAHGIRGIGGRELGQGGFEQEMMGEPGREPPSSSTASTTVFPTEDLPLAPSLSPTSSPVLGPADNNTTHEDQYSLPVVSTIEFEDVSDTSIRAPIPEGYHGLDWGKFFVYHRSWLPGTGFEKGTGTSDYAAFNNVYRSDPCSISSKSPFSVLGFNATAFDRYDMNFLVESLDGSGNLVGSHTTTLDGPDRRNSIDLQGGSFEDIYELKITASGGECAGLHSCGTYFAIDDLKVSQ